LRAPRTVADCVVEHELVEDREDTAFVHTFRRDRSGTRLLVCSSRYARRAGSNSLDPVA
jgi:hypothetical protein